MTTNAQPTTPNGRGRKRPLTETTAPLASPLPATAGPPDLSFFNAPPTSTPSSAANMYANDSATAPMLPPSQEDLYRHQATASPQASAMYDANNQLVRVPRANQLVHMPAPFNNMAAPAIPSSMMPGPMPLNMNIMNVPGVMGGPHTQYNQQMVGPADEPPDGNLVAKIQSMKKKRANIPPFVLKLSSFVNDPSSDNLIRWSDSGNSFVVLDEDEFSKRLIPDLFKHNKYASFVRQLNMYGFHKVVGLADGSLKTSEQRSKPPSEYENPYFKRGQPDLMWLIQKAKSKSTRPKMKRGIDQDSDKEGDMSDAGGGGGAVGGDGDMAGGGGGYLEGVRDSRAGNNSSGGGGHRGRGFDFSALTAQVDAVRNHQTMISQAIKQLRKDHQQLYEQSLAFQSLHDRHENSINAILTFLATVYDKSLGGHLNGAVNNLFSHQVDQGQGMHRGTQGGPSVGGAAPNGAVIPAVPTGRLGVMRTPQMRRRPLLLESGPMAYSAEQQQQQQPQQQQHQDASPVNGQPSSSGAAKPTGSPRQSYQQQQLHHREQQQQQYPQHPSIEELLTPKETTTPPAESPQLRNIDHASGLNQSGSGSGSGSATTAFFPPPSLPNSPTTATATTAGPPNKAHFTTAAAAAAAAAAPPGLSLPNNHGADTTPVQTPRSIAKAHGSPFPGTVQALQDHRASLAQKSREIEELENLQTKQAENIDQLMGIMEGLSSTSGEGHDVADGDDAVDEFFNFALPGDGFGEADGFIDDPHGNLDIEDFLRAIVADGDGGQNGAQKPGEVLGTNPSTVAASPAASSVGSRGRDEADEDAEGVQPKRRRVA